MELTASQSGSIHSKTLRVNDALHETSSTYSDLIELEPDNLTMKPIYVDLETVANTNHLSKPH